MFNIHFEHHFILIRNALLPSHLSFRSSALLRKPQPTANGNQHTEVTSLLDQEGFGLVGHDPSLPSWCNVDMAEYTKSRSWLKKFICGPNPPPSHHTLFWFERKGGKASVLILQLNLLGLGIYLAMLLLAFFPAIYKSHGIIMLVAYMIISMVPAVVIMLNKKRLVAIMSQTLCIGAHRNPPAVANVIREEKTARVVRSFIVLYKMHRAAKSCVVEAKTGKTPHYTEIFNANELVELGKTFDAFDKSGDGNISKSEFGGIMESLGVHMTDKELRQMVAMLDVDGDGEVSKEEFFQWYADQQQGSDDDLTVKERAHFLFDMFDADGSGEISVGEFKSTLDAFNIGFSVDEVGELVKELDEDGSGTIGVEEFEELLERYHPKELVEVDSSGNSMHRSTSYGSFS